MGGVPRSAGPAGSAESRRPGGSVGRRPPGGSVGRRPSGWDFRLTDGTPSVGWRPVGAFHRLAAWLLDLALFCLTLGVGWLAWTWREWAHGSTPGKSIMGMAVFDSSTRRPADRPRMVKRALIYQGVVVLLGLSTLGLGWLYCLAGLVGSNRRTHCDEWSGAVLLASPGACWRRRTGIEPA